jgi:mRNA interferase HigB
VKIQGLSAIDKFKRDHANSRSALDNWVKVTAAATWKTHVDVKATWSSADLISGDRWIFNAGGNNCRIDTYIWFDKETVHVSKVMTHGKYDKEKFK